MNTTHNELSLALRDSISEEISSTAADLIEVGLDSILDDGLLKDIPVLSTAISLYRIGCNLQERHYVKKLAEFVYALNNGANDEAKRNYYKSRISDNPKKRNKELEYILILLDHYLHSDKAEKLAKLYLSYLDNSIDWNTLAKSAEILDRLLPGDYEELLTHSWKNVDDAVVSDALLRLVSLGLVISHSKSINTPNTTGTLIIPAATIKDYELTDFGIVFLRCFSDQ